jgi:hypothetical protein
VATVLFASAIAFSALMSWRSRDQRRQQAQEERELRVAQEAVAAHGPFMFTEPLRPSEAQALSQYIGKHPHMPASDLLRISERYQDAGVMLELARDPFCPPEALNVVFEKTIKSSRSPWVFPASVYVQETFRAMAGRDDTPPAVLGKLLDVARSPEVRVAALKNPHVPPSDKIAYEETLCARPLAETHYDEEFQFAAFDADAPPQVMQCLAKDRAFRHLVATSPHASIELLEQLAGPDIDEETRKAALENIQKRGTAKQ